MTTYKTYAVTLRKQFPAWDEVNGIDCGEFTAPSKSDAVRQARRLQRDNGNDGGGLCWYTATEVI